MPPKLALAPQPIVPAAGPSRLAPSRQEPRPIIKTSKEWVLPARPKPGRKPAQVEPETSRKAVNRASQRAFRERRQEYVGELEEKVRVLEQGEGEKSVFFQQQAREAKEESDQLRLVNAGLRRVVEDLRSALSEHQSQCGLALGGAKGKGRSISDDNDAELPPSKRTRRAAARFGAPPASFPDPASGGTPPSDLDDTPSTAVSPLADPGDSPGEPCCGLCSADGSCFCADVGYRIDHSHTQPAAPLVREVVAAPADFETSQVAVPLRLRKSTAKPVVWALDGSASLAPQPALCNGDPSTCPACQNDPFAKAFCNALSESVCSTNPCATCPTHHPSASFSLPIVTSQALPVDKGKTLADEQLYDALADLPCCGEPGLCGSLTCAPKVPPSSALDDGVLLPRNVDPGVRTVETLPCNEAWTVLKCHPNIAFADLQMLADVVAKRTRCDGPVNLGSTSSSNADFRSRTPPLGLPKMADADFQLPRLVSHEMLVCAADAGQRRRLTVERGAVNDALKFLDRAVGRGH